MKFLSLLCILLLQLLAVAVAVKTRIEARYCTTGAWFKRVCQMVFDLDVARDEITRLSSCESRHYATRLWSFWLLGNLEFVYAHDCWALLMLLLTDIPSAFYLCDLRLVYVLLLLVVNYARCALPIHNCLFESILLLIARLKLIIFLAHRSWQPVTFVVEGPARPSPGVLLEDGAFAAQVEQGSFT